MNTKTIKFDLNKYKLYEKIKAKQGDTKSRFLLFQLLDGSIPFNLKNRSVRAYMIKPDGREIFNDLIVNNYNLGYCTLELTNQVLAAQGIVKIELMVTEGDKKLTSSVFELEVVKSINSEKSIVSTNEFTALLNGLAALSEYDNYKNSVKEMEINKANKAEVEEKFISVEEKIKNNSEQLDNIIQKDNSIVINPKFPPEGYTACKMDGVSDDTQAFQSLINNFSNIALPEGTLRFTHLTLNSNTRITGLGINKTILNPLKTDNINAISLSVGPNVNINLDNFSLIGNDENLNQNGLYFNATASVESPYHGGLWLSRFSNIIIKNFKGTQLVLSAGSNGLLPHQGLVFERVECSAHSNVTTSKALTVQGQSEQILWLQCAFSGEGSSDVVSEFITTSGGDVGGGSQTFLQCYFGNGKTGVKLERSKYVKFSNCYLENLEVGHTSNKSCEHIIFENSNYQLVKKCHNGIDSASEILLYKNVLIGCTTLIDGWGVFTHKDNKGCDVVVNERRDRNIELNQLTVDSLYTRVNNNDTLLNLSSKVLYDEILLTAWNENGFIINTGGNIDVKNSITINHLETVILKRISDKWIIISKTL